MRVKTFTAVKFCFDDVSSHIWGKDAAVKGYFGFQEKLGHLNDAWQLSTVLLCFCKQIPMLASGKVLHV